MSIPKYLKYTVSFTVVALMLSLTAGSQQLAGNETIADDASAVITTKDTAAIDSILSRAQWFIIKPGEDHKDLDSAIFLANKTEAISRKIDYAAGISKSLLLIGMANKEKGNTDKGKSFVQQSIDFSVSKNLPELTGDSYMEMMHFYTPWENDKRKIRIDIIKKADSAYELAGNKEKQAMALQNLGDCYQVDGKPNESLVCLKKAQKLFESIGYKKMQGIYDLLGFSYAAYFNDHHTGLKYALMAYDYAIKNNDSSSQMGTICSRLAQIYSYIGNYAAADKYFARAFEIFKKANETGNMYLVGIESATNHEYSENFAQTMRFLLEADKTLTVPDYLAADYDAIMLKVYNQIGDLNTAERFLASILKRPETKQHPVSIVSVIIYYTDRNNFPAAEKWLKIFNDFTKLLPGGKLVYNGRSYLLSSRIKEKMGNYKGALADFKQYKITNDTLFNSRRTNQIAALEAEFESEKKDRDLQLNSQHIELLTSRNLVQQQEIRQSQFTRNAIMASAVVLLIVLGLLYNQYRIKQQSNKKINSKNLELEKLIEEKEWLLKEIHHRVKNNLQTVVSLLESQSAYLKDDALFAIQESQNRIYTMSLIHQKLYQTENTTSIKMDEYLPELTNYLRDMLDPKHHIRFNISVDQIELDVSQAVPVGLILNEAVTNSMKYAFAHSGVNNNINIEMKQEAMNRIKLKVSDNGNGLPEAFDINKSSGLGLKLMKGLTDDLGGKFDIVSGDGTTIVVEFTANALF